jgi:type IV pilus assembly protein PilC
MTATMYAYEALDADGTVRKGKIQSDSPEAVASSLAAQNLVPLSVDATGQGMRREITLPQLRGRTTLKDLAVMSRQFASMTTAGLTLLRALTILAEQTEKPRLKAAITAVSSDVQEGSTLSTAMARHPEHFPSLMVSMVRAGESGGFLDDALSRIASMYEADASLRAKIKSAMTYPVIVLIFSLLLGAGVIWFIVPVFEKMFKQLGGDLPLPTKIMVTLSHNMWWVVPVLIVGGFAGWRAYKRAVLKSEKLRLTVDTYKLRLPVFGPLMTKLAISRWARTLATLLAVGVPIIRALEIVGGTAGNAVVGEAMKDVRAAVRVGAPISRPLAKHPLFPNMVVQMMEVGEQTGQTSQMLEKVADFYEDEANTATESLTSALEPLMVVLLGAVIGVMVVCLYLPMFSVYQHIQAN